MTESLYRPWLKSALDETGVSQSELARRMTDRGLPMTADKINKSLSGERRLWAEEAFLAAECLGIQTPAPMVPIVGRVGADPDGRILYAEGDAPNDFVPAPPGGSLSSVAVDVVGHSMAGIAEDGSLIYYEDVRKPPSEDMVGEVVVVGTPDGEVMVKRLIPGSEPGHYHLQSANGHVRPNVAIEWAAEITAFIPPKRARKIRQSAEFIEISAMPADGKALLSDALPPAKRRRRDGSSGSPGSGARPRR